MQANGGKPPTGEEVKKGFEMINDFTLGGLVPPLEITPTDHEGGGWVQIFQVKGDKLVQGDRMVPRLSRHGAEDGQRRRVTASLRRSRAGPRGPARQAASGDSQC